MDTEVAARQRRTRTRTRSGATRGSSLSAPALSKSMLSKSSFSRPSRFDGSSRTSALSSDAGSGATTERTVNLEEVDKHEPRGRVQTSDAELRRRAQRTADAMVDLHALARGGRALHEWKRRGRSSHGFATFSRHVDASGDRKRSATAWRPRMPPTAAVATPAEEEAFQMLMVGELACSLEEAERAVSPTGDADYNAAMNALFKKEYIYGSVVHVAAVPTRTDEDLTRLAVKTATFVHSSVFTQNEQWCFLELSRRYISERGDPESTGKCFVTTRSSMHERELAAGKAPQYGRVAHLHGVTTGCLLEDLDPGTRLAPRVRIVVFVQFSPSAAAAAERAHLGEGKAVTTSVARKRLSRLIKAACKLPDVVRRRRLGTQTLVDRSAFEPDNSRCICCTKSLGFRFGTSAKKRCDLCGYSVCDRCWSVQQMESRFGQVTTLQVCTRCLEFVDGDDYRDVAPETLGPIQVHPDSTEDSAKQNTEPAGPEGGNVLATLLEEAMVSSQYYATRKKSVMKVIKQLVDAERRGNGADKVAGEGSSQEGMPPRLDKESSEKEYVTALRRMSTSRRPPLRPEPSELPNAAGRPYPIDLPDTTLGTIEGVVPLGDQERVAAIEQGGLLQIKDTEELDLICLLAARELDCSTSIVTIVGRDEQVVLASNVPSLRGLRTPRDQSICQHTVMSAKPLVVPHIGADIRFRKLGGSSTPPFKFYCGFPIPGEGGGIVGAFCCVDAESHQMTRSQYSVMKRLSATASKLVRLKGQEALAASILIQNGDRVVL